MDFRSELEAASLLVYPQAGSGYADRGLDLGRRVVLVDDVVTRGSTLIGAVRRLRTVVPGAEISGFAVFATSDRSVDRPEDIVQPSRWRIGIDEESGRPMRRSL